jgi:mRNA interferase RelE/StbE
MKVLFERSFLKDINTLTNTKLKKQIEQIIIEMESAVTISELGNSKKMKGHKSAYRIRIGDYRLGFFYENDIVTITRILHRKEIYKYFP